MTETTLKNLKENGNKILENSSMILKLLCENVKLITGLNFIYDIMFDGSVAIVCGEEKRMFKNSLCATEFLTNFLKEIIKN
jgi:hypothetical protein